jgi:hypothetical protein
MSISPGEHQPLAYVGKTQSFVDSPGCRIIIEKAYGLAFLKQLFA